MMKPELEPVRILDEAYELLKSKKLCDFPCVAFSRTGAFFVVYFQ